MKKFGLARELLRNLLRRRTSASSVEPRSECGVRSRGRNHAQSLAPHSLPSGLTSGAAVPGRVLKPFPSVLFFALLALLQLRPVDDLDTFAQIRLGQVQMVCVCNPPSSAISYTLAAHTHLPNPGWLAQVIFALLYNLGSWPLLKLCHDACLVAALVFGAFFFATSQRGLLGASIFGFLTLASNTSIRPQVVAFAAMTCLTVMVSSKLKARTAVALAVPLFLIWQNSHPSLMIGFVWLVSLAAARLIQRIAGSRAPSACSLSTLMVLSAAALVLQVATPETFGIFGVSQDNLQTARNLLRISEWLPPWETTVRSAMAGFWLISAITFYLAFHYRRDLSWELILPAAVFWLFSLYSARLSFFLVPAAMPLWVTLGNRLEVGRLLLAPGPRIASALCVCLAGFVLWRAILVPPRYHQSVPRAAIESLQKAKPSGRVYNYREWAGPLVLASAGKWTVAIDGRLYLYPPAAWSAYENAALGRVNLADLTQQFRPDAFFLHRHFHSGLIELLSHSPDWKSIYLDQQAAVFVPHRTDDARSR